MDGGFIVRVRWQNDTLWRVIIMLLMCFRMAWVGFGLYSKGETVAHKDRVVITERILIPQFYYKIDAEIGNSNYHFEVAPHRHAERCSRLWWERWLVAILVSNSCFCCGCLAVCNRSGETPPGGSFWSVLPKESEWIAVCRREGVEGRHSGNWNWRPTMKIEAHRPVGLLKISDSFLL